MTNGEKYKKAFSVLQTSKGSLQEVENMAKLQKRTKMKTAPPTACRPARRKLPCISVRGGSPC